MKIFITLLTLLLMACLDTHAALERAAKNSGKSHYKTQMLTRENFDMGVGIITAPSLLKVQAPVRTPQRISVADSQFVKTAAVQGWMEMEVANLAQDRTLMAELSLYTNSLLRDQSLALTQLEQMAEQKGIQLGQNRDPIIARVLERLSKLSSDEFTGEYLSALYKLHHRTIAIYENAAIYSKDEEIRVFAENQLPVMRRHLQHVRSLRNDLSKGELTAR